MVLHVYDTRPQPATCYNVGEPIGQTHYVRNPPTRLVTTNCCRRKRQAQYVIVKVFYSDLHFLCAAGHGCRANDR